MSSSAGAIYATSPGSLMSHTDSLIISRRLLITRNNETESEFYIKAQQDFQCDANITFVGDPAQNDRNWIEWEVGTIKITPNCIISGDHRNDIFHFRPSCSGQNCSLYFEEGIKENLEVGFVMKNSELQNIEIKGQLILGDSNSTRDVDHIILQGMQYYSADRGLDIMSRWDVSLLLFFFFATKE